MLEASTLGTAHAHTHIRTSIEGASERKKKEEDTYMHTQFCTLNRYLYSMHHIAKLLLEVIISDVRGLELLCAFLVLHRGLGARHLCIYISNDITLHCLISANRNKIIGSLCIRPFNESQRWHRTHAVTAHRTHANIAIINVSKTHALHITK